MEANNTLQQAGDVSIEKVKIITQTGFFQDVTNQVIGIQIFEDILSPFITGTLVIRDSVDLINLFPFVGEEYLELKLSTPTVELGVIDSTFYIYKMTDRVMTGDKAMVYQLHFTAIEALVDLNRSVSKSFSGTVSDIAKTLITDKVYGLQTSKKYEIQETSNKTKYVSNFWSPVKNLIYLTDQAASKSGAPSYVFFEIRNGFNFLSLEVLYKNPDVYQEFIYDNYTRDKVGTGPKSDDARNMAEDYKRITNIKIPVGLDYIDRIRSGMYGSRMYTHDITTKRISSFNFDMLEKYKDRSHLNEFPTASKKVVYRYSGKTMFEPKYYNNYKNVGDVTNTKILQERRSLLKQAESNKIEIDVPGRLDYTIGYKCRVTLNKTAPTNERDNDFRDKMFSGNYIMTAINHFITRDSHECRIELSKDSLSLDLDGTK